MPNIEHPPPPRLVVGTVAVRKSTFLPARPSVRPSLRTYLDESHCTVFNVILYLDYLPEFVDTCWSRLKSDKNNRQFARRTLCTRNLSTKSPASGAILDWCRKSGECARPCACILVCFCTPSQKPGCVIKFMFRRGRVEEKIFHP